MSASCWRLFGIRVSLNTSSASCLRCPPGQFSFIPHKVDFKESLSRGLMLQIELRLNRSARATRAQWSCWVFLPRAKHVVQPRFTLCLSTAKSFRPILSTLVLQMEKNLRPREAKGQKEEALNQNSGLPPLYPSSYTKMWKWERSHFSFLWGRVRQWLGVQSLKFQWPRILPYTVMSLMYDPGQVASLL